ncbi:MAG: PSD1 and planctomycete cytochrome C domain-containing protein [Bryobacteraceae bacterium]
MAIRLWMLVVVALGLRLAAAPVDFEKNVLPVLNARCSKCHGPKLRMAGLDLHEASLVLRGSDNGPVIVKGSADGSLLVKRIVDGSMPPGKEVKLTGEEIDVIRRWVDAGAPANLPAATVAAVEPASVSEKDRQFWAFQKPLRPPVPEVRNSALGRTPVDAFLLEKLEAKKLSFAPEASRTKLARRAYFDLIGLPPTPEEVDAFVSDQSHDAYEKLIDRLLASPHYGERWGRHWLDVAGYVDTFGRDVQANGYKIGPGRWKYRDYVVNAFNSDKPYDRFLKEQLAGDELVDWRNAKEYNTEILDALTGTGYLRTVEDPTDTDERNTVLLRYGVLHQTIDILSSGVLGLTVGCARCHSHKFDPIPQRDYYRLMAVLSPALNVEEWVQPQDRVVADVPEAEKTTIDGHNAMIEAQAAPLREQLAAIGKIYEEQLLDKKLESLPGGERAAVKAAVQTIPKHRTGPQKLLAKKVEPLSFKPAQIQALMTEEHRRKTEELQTQIRLFEARRRAYGKLEVLRDTGAPPRTFLHRRGDHESQGPDVEPGALEVLEDPEAPLTFPAYTSGKQSTGRRLALAEWLTDGGSVAGGLVARVMVNRIWSHVFGEGIVATPENFGKMGAPPTHPELLDWLTSEFIRSGWRVKPMVKSLMLSAAYRQDSSRPGDSHAQTADPDNRLLWRMRMRRLESEVIRDSMLAVSGTLDRSFGGPPIPINVRPDGMVVISEKDLPSPAAKCRRSLYLVARRRFNLSMLGVFDHPVMSTNATHRSASAVVLQSLMMLNGDEVMEQARRFAERIAQAAGNEPAPRISAAFRMAFGRPPSEKELVWAGEFYTREAARHAESREQSALASLCHVLFNSNEFLYVE